MSRKKSEKDVVANFFGDDLDWLNDEEGEESAEGEPSAEGGHDEGASGAASDLPVAPPPGVGKGVSLEKISDIDGPLPGAEQPTLVYSDVPTIMPDEEVPAQKDSPQKGVKALAWFGGEGPEGDQEEASMFSDTMAPRGGRSSGEFTSAPHHLDKVDVTDADDLEPLAVSSPVEVKDVDPVGPQEADDEEVETASGAQGDAPDVTSETREGARLGGSVHQESSEEDAWRTLLVDLSDEAEEVAESAPLKRSGVQLAWSRFGSGDEVAGAVRSVGGASTANTERIAAAHFARSGQEELRDAAQQRAAALGGQSEDALEATYLLGCGLGERGRAGEAADAWNSILGVDDSFGEAHLRMLQASSGGLPLTTGTLDLLERSVTGAWQARLRAKRVHLDETADSADLWAKVCEVSPTHGPAWNAVWNLKREQGLGAEAGWCEEVAQNAACPGWWWRRAAALYEETGQLEDATRCQDQSKEAVGDVFNNERPGRLMEAGDLKAFVACVEGGPSSESMTPQVRYLVARIKERELGQVDAALEDYRAVVAGDPAAWPAHDAICRLLGSAGASEERVSALEAWRVSGVSSARHEQLCVRLGELYEVQGEVAKAGERFEGAFDAAGDPGVILKDAMRRSLQAQGRWEELALHYVNQMDPDASPRERADNLYKAASASSVVKEMQALALRYAEQALGMDPSHEPSLSLALWLWSEQGEWTKAAEACSSCSVAHEHPEKQGLYAYRAAQIYMDHLKDEEAGREALSRALDSLSMDPAVQSLARGLGMGTTDAAAHWSVEAGQSEGAGAGWARFEAALCGETRQVIAEHLAALMHGDPADPSSVRQIHDWFAFDSTDSEGRVERLRAALRNSGGPGAACSVLTEAYAAHHRGEADTVGELLADLVATEVEGWPVRAAAWLAESTGDLRLAMAMWGKHPDAGAGMEEVRLLGEGGRVEEALAHLGQTQERTADASTWGIHVELCASVGQEVEPGVWRKLAEAFTDDGLAAGAFRLAAEAYERAGDEQGALDSWAAAWGRNRTHRYGRGWMDEAVKQGAAWGLEGTEDVFPSLEWAVVRSRFDGAAEGLARMEGAQDVPERVRLLCVERFQALLGDWSAVLQTLEAVKKLLVSDGASERAEARARWVLSEKMTDSEEAWEYYQRLLEQYPADPHVLEALARMAGARGDVDRAASYLEGLLATAETAEDVSRVHVRRGEILASNARWEEAEQAYLSSLESVAHDLGSLTGLESVYEALERWDALRDVCGRRAELEEGDARANALRRAALLAKEHASDPQVELAAWEAVVAFEPMDEDALTELVRSAEAANNQAAVLQYGAVLAGMLEGDEQSTCFVRVGRAAESEGHAQIAADHYRRANAVSGPSKEASEALERIARESGQWDGVVEALLERATLEEEADGQVRLLHEAALVELDKRRDDQAAEALYQGVLALDAKDVVALRFVANRAYSDERFEEALAACEGLAPLADQGLDLEDFDVRMSLAEFHCMHGRLRLNAGEQDRVIESLERALEFNPSHRSSLGVLGEIYESMDRWSDASGVYKRVLQLAGGHEDRGEMANQYASLGRVEWAQDKEDKAYSRFNRALEFSPNHVGALRGLAGVLEKRKEWSNLLKVYNNIIYHATKPGDVIHAYMTKGRVLDEELGRTDKAKQHFQRSLDFDGDQPVAYLRLAELALREGDFPTSERLADSGLKLLENGEEGVHATLGMIRAGAKALGGDLEGGIQAMAEMGPLPKGVDAPDLSVASAVSEWVCNRLPR